MTDEMGNQIARLVWQRDEWKRRACEAERALIKLDPSWLIDWDRELSDDVKERIVAAASEDLTP